MSIMTIKLEIVFDNRDIMRVLSRMNRLEYYVSHTIDNILSIYRDELVKTARVAKYPRRWDRTFKRGRLKESIESRKLSSWEGVINGVAYGLILEYGSKGWKRTRNKPYVFDVKTSRSRKRRSRGRWITIVTPRVGYKYGLSGRTPKTRWISKVINKNKRTITTLLNFMLEVLLK